MFQIILWAVQLTGPDLLLAIAGVVLATRCRGVPTLLVAFGFCALLVSSASSRM